MRRLFPTSKQIALASSLGITNAASLTSKQLSKLIGKALDEQNRVNDERVQEARDTDMLELASNYTEMSRQSWRYHCGPCPICKKAVEDGFVVDTYHNSWFCRKCDDKGTPIGFLINKENLSFWEAVTELVGESYVPLVPAERRVPVKKKKAVFLWGKDKWQHEAQRMVSESVKRLAGDNHNLTQYVSTSMVSKEQQSLARDSDVDFARDYLNYERAISMVTARAWRLGQARVRFKVRKGNSEIYEDANAIIMPWMGPNGLIKAIQYRLIGGASRRFHSKYGGQKTIYGAHLLAPSPDKLLVIAEGEFNAISIWQEAHQMDLPVDVISIGGEGVGDERLCSLLQLVERYRGCIAWLDRVEIARKVGNYLEDAMLLESPNGYDANQLAQSGELTGIVKAIYKSFEPIHASVIAIPTRPTTITKATSQSTLYDLLDEAGSFIEKLSGKAAAKGYELYLELEDAVVNLDFSAGQSVLARIRMLHTQQAWDDLTPAAVQGETNNALYL